MNKACISICTTIPASEDTLELVEPGKQTFDFPATLVSTQSATILSNCTFAVAFVWCDQFYTLFCQEAIERITVVGAIPNKSFGSSQRDGFIERSFDKGDFMWASRRRVHGEWKTSSVCNNHELCTLAPLGLSHFWTPFFASTNVPSIKHSDKSICPTSSRWRASVSNILRNTPSLTHRLNRRKQVEPDGNRSGKSAQQAPVRNTHKIPLSTARLSCISGLPRPSLRRVVFGIKGANTLHCSSVSSSLRVMLQS